MDKIIKRRYLGVLNTTKPMEKRSFHNKHLKAYLKGSKRFQFGLTVARQPNYFRVMEQIKIINPQN